jgi:AcrR family transcriptional regulator
MSREAILESAAQVFRQKGFHGASMVDIAEAVQLQKASLYHHFSSKQDILLELLDRALDMVIAGMLQVMAQNLPADEKLRLAMRSYLKLLSEQGDLVSVMLLEHRSLGVDAGVFACDNIPLTVRGLMGVMNWTITWYRPGGELSIAEISDDFASMFMNGLKK